MTEHANIDPRELAKFESAATRWWDLEGEFRTLHDINPLRLRYIDERASLGGKKVIDVGCGGGILAEAMAARGAEVTGVDASEAAIGTARLHQFHSGTEVEYIRATPEAFAAEHPAGYDVVTCMELLEHVPQPEPIVRACARLAKPGGHLFFSTLHRTVQAYLLAVLGAEYLLGLLPRGTHDYARFIRPSELAGWARPCGLQIEELSGLRYNPFTRECALSTTVSVNYLLHARSEDDRGA